MPGTWPLDGIRVLDLSRVMSGPFAGRLLADFGADVVKVEPPEGDLVRRFGQVRHGLSGFYTQQSAGKRNVSVDLRVAGASAVVADLAAVADVVIENFRPGTMARHGLDWPALSSRNPRLVMLSVTGFGQDGPDAHRQAYAPVIHAEAGLLARQASFDETSPSDPMMSIADSVSALHGLSAVLAALFQRVRTGRGQHIDLSMLDAMLVTDDYTHHAVDRSPVRRLGGQVLDAVGGPILVATDGAGLWHRLRQVYGLHVDDGPDASRDDRIAARAAATQRWVSSFTERTTLQEALAGADLAWADVRTSEQALDSPTARHRGVVTEVDDRAGGRRGVVRGPWRFSDAETGVRGPAPYRGEHNAEVLREWLGRDEATIAALVAEGVLIREER